MSHDAKVLLGREVTVRGHTKSKSSYHIVATSSDDEGKIRTYLMSEKGDISCFSLKSLQFKKVWDYKTSKLVDAKE